MKIKILSILTLIIILGACKHSLKKDISKADKVAAEIGHTRERGENELYQKSVIAKDPIHGPYYVISQKASGGEDKIKTREIITEDKGMIPPEPPKINLIYELPEYIKQQRQQRTTPARDMIIEVSDTLPTHTEIYYYSPRMENGNYSYRKELGNDNNFLGITDFDNKARITIPDTCEQGAKLMFHSQGYQPLDLPIENIRDKNHVTVILTPKIYNSTAILEEKIFWDTISVIEIINLHETPARVFYGECLPIYGDDGNHGDPYCAFACMGCYPEFNVFKEYHSSEPDELKKLHQILKEGGNCNLVISVDKRKIRKIDIEGCPNEALNHFRQSLLTTRQGNYNGYRFQYRIHFTAR